jgi:hypothetical protein
LVVAGLAASVALAICLQPFLVSTKPSWGFGRADILASKKRNDAYLRELADAARQWRAKRPANAEELAVRLDQFVAGCDALIASTKTQLTNADDRTWLTTKCRDWRNALAAHATRARDAGRFATTLEEADGTVDMLIDALEDRAKTIVRQT